MAAGRAMFLWAAVNPDKVQEIAAAIQESAGGPPGAVTGAIGGATKAELSIARKLAAEGKNVEIVAATGVGRTADFLVSGIKTELKTLKDLGPDASKTVMNAIGRAKGQSGTILIDAQNVNLTVDQARRGVTRAFGAYEKAKVVRVIGKDFDITIPRPK